VRGSRVAFVLASKVARIARQERLVTMLIQTTSSRLERFLRINGFETVFCRSCHVRR
jgi:hypothetical protein